MTDSSRNHDVVVRAPIEFLAGHHDRQGVMCAGLERLVDNMQATDAAESARLILAYLDDELPRHIADEEEDLFPLMQERCEEDDGFDDLLAMLEGEHESDLDLLERLKGPLRRLAAGETPDDPDVFARDAISFATLQRRHLAWENGAVLPLARQRLTRDDLDAMAQSMTARRQGSA